MAPPKGKSNNPNGRKAGVPNKSTTAAREAIARFVDGNAHRLQQWLDEIAEGKMGEDGEFITLPNPEKAFTLFQSVVEYHVPKLSRAEVKHEGELTVSTLLADLDDPAK